MNPGLRRLDLVLTAEEIDALCGQGNDVGIRSLLARGLATVLDEHVVTSSVLGAAARVLVGPGIDVAIQTQDAKGVGRVRVAADDELLVVERPDPVGNLRLTITAASLLQQLVAAIAFDDDPPVPAPDTLVVSSSALMSQIDDELALEGGTVETPVVNRVTRMVSVARMEIGVSAVKAHVVTLIATSAGWYRLEQGEKGFTACTPAGFSDLDEVLLVPNVGG